MFPFTAMLKVKDFVDIKKLPLPTIKLVSGIDTGLMFLKYALSLMVVWGNILRFSGIMFVLRA